tara:strand:+ start:5308 stop:5796 length:489 start_codon:yes stop_codon:yes gene_type:complete
MTNFLKKITDANFLPGKKSRGNNHYVYSSIFNSLMDKLIPIVTAEKEVTVEKLKYEGFNEITGNAVRADVTTRAGSITFPLTEGAGSKQIFRVYFFDIAGNTIPLTENAMIVATLKDYSGTGIPIIQATRAVTTFFQIDFRNIHASDSLNATATINYFILNF